MELGMLCICNWNKKKKKKKKKGDYHFNMGISLRFQYKLTQKSSWQIYPHVITSSWGHMKVQAFKMSAAANWSIEKFYSSSNPNTESDDKTSTVEFQGWMDFISYQPFWVI